MENQEQKNEALIGGSGLNAELANTLTGNFTIGTIKAVRVENQTPIAYRLGKRQDGVLVLQGAYTWWEGLNSGHEWRDIPTVDL
jgi:hypothetical protein